MMASLKVRERFDHDTALSIAAWLAEVRLTNLVVPQQWLNVKYVPSSPSELTSRTPSFKTSNTRFGSGDRGAMRQSK